MEKNNIKRNEITYSACAWACEKGGKGDIALHVLDLMHAEVILTLIYLKLFLTSSFFFNLPCSYDMHSVFNLTKFK